MMMTRSQTKKAASVKVEVPSCSTKIRHNTRSVLQVKTPENPVKTRSSLQVKTSEPSRIQTRSQSKAENLLNTKLDFDGASRAWLRNKVRQGNGMYTYK